MYFFISRSEKMDIEQEINEVKAKVKKLGFSDMFEFIFYHWNEFPEEDRKRLEYVGISPKNTNMADRINSDKKQNA